MKPTLAKLLLHVLLIFFTGNPIFSQQAKFKVSVSYSNALMSKNDTFKFTLDNGEKITIDFTNRTRAFARQFLPRETYKVTQLSGTRTCNLWSQNSEGVIANEDVTVGINCGYPPRINAILDVSGVEPGETFVFANEYGNSYYVTLNRKYPIHNFPIGDYYIFKQNSGPRQCKLINGTGITPDSSFTIYCDCSNPFTPPPPPASAYDLISRSSDNKILNTYYESGAPVIAGKNEDEGRYVAFTMYGKGIDGSSGNYRQVYWRDRKENITKLISKNTTGAEGDGNSFAPSISADGRSVVFETHAKNLAVSDGNSVRDVYHWSQTTGTLTHISKSQAGEPGNSESYEPVISGDGNSVAYTSGASNIVTLEPVFNTPNVYVYDIRSGSTSFITKDYDNGKAAGGYAPAISDDGSKIAFCAFTSRLVQDDKNNLWDIFLWEKGKPGLKRISVPSIGAERDQGTESSSRVVWPSISGDGSSIVFATTSTTLAGDDRNGTQDIFLYSTITNSIKRVSTLNNTTEGNGDSPISQGERIGISYDGKWITYNTNATNFGVPKGNIVVQNTISGKIIPVTSITTGSTGTPMLSRHGYYVVAGCSESFDKRYPSSGLFTFYVNLNQESPIKK
jgi:hypothetical protein